MKNLIIIVLLYIVPITVQAQFNEKDSEIPFSQEVEKSVSLDKICSQIVKSGKFQTIKRDKSGKIAAKLGRVAISDDTIFYRIKIRNKSNINYDIDFIRFYVRDLKTARRTVSQELEIYPLYSYGIEDSTIDGQSSSEYVFALHKTPLSKDKALFIELYEDNGGRHMYLKADQSDIENARPVK